MRPELYFILPDDNNPKEYILYIKPHPMFSTRNKVRLISREELLAIDSWRRSSRLIQEALPHWSQADRELLLTGMDDSEFKRKVGAEDETESG